MKKSKEVPISYTSCKARLITPMNYECLSVQLQKHHNQTPFNGWQLMGTRLCSLENIVYQDRVITLWFMHLSNKISFPLKRERASTRVANKGENVKCCAKEEGHRHYTTLPLVLGHGDGVLSGLHSSLNLYIIWSMLNLVTPFLMPAPLPIKLIKQGQAPFMA